MARIITIILFASFYSSCTQAQHEDSWGTMIEDEYANSRQGTGHVERWETSTEFDPSTSTQIMPQSTSQMFPQIHTVRDPSCGGMPVCTYQIPADWQAQSNVIPNYYQNSIIHPVYMRLQPQDGSATVEIYPQFFYMHNPSYAQMARSMGMEAVGSTPYLSPTQYFQARIKPHLQQLRFTSMEEQPPQPIAGGQTLQIGRIHATDHRGLRYSFVLYHFKNNYGGALGWTSQMAILSSAPSTYTANEATFNRLIQQGAQMNPRWVQMAQQRIQQYGQDQRGLANDISNIAMNQHHEHQRQFDGQYPSSGSTQGSYNTGLLDDTDREGFTDAILGQQRYLDADGNEHVIDGYSDRAFTDGHGSYIQTNSMLFDPTEIAPYGQYEELQQKRYD